MILIADSGSTKCDWVVIGQNKKIELRTTTKGINSRYLSIAQITEILKGSETLFKIKDKVSKILFYGAGCGIEQSKLKLETVFKNFFRPLEIKIEEDLTAAVHGTTTTPAVVCILGTGSNCCFYDGTKIHIHQSSLGYSVMDEGSGNYFGKQLLRSYFYNQMPNEVKNSFEQSFDLSLDDVLTSLYQSENPSTYLASFARFLIHNRKHPFIANIINIGINELFDTLLMCYEKELKTNPLHFVGSVGDYLQEDIRRIGKSKNYTIGSFVKKPIENLITNIDE